MSASNGNLPASDLGPIPGGQLRKDAATAWNAPGGPADAGLLPTGPRSSYRTLAEQRELFDELGSGMAAFPGTSNHGLGIAIDLPEAWMWEWMQENGAKYGWQKTEAFHEPWHWNWVPGSASFPTFQTLKRGSRGRRVVRLTKRLAFIHRKRGGAYLPRWYWRYKPPVEDAVRAFQRAYRLTVDGEIGPKTAAKINAVFHRQYRARGKK